MKTLFKKPGKRVYIADNIKQIISIDGIFYDKYGKEVNYNDKEYDKSWYQYWMAYEGLEEPLKSESVCEVIWETDDEFGMYGFKNSRGEFVIEPQFASAHEFTNGLAAVNLNRTWYKDANGNRFYENHYGYIDNTGKTVIQFQYDEAYPFNKYGVALVCYRNTEWFLIDKKGNEIPGTRFPYIGMYDYEDRFIEFSAEDGESDLIGIYDTKERKAIDPKYAGTIFNEGEECICVHSTHEEYGGQGFREYYINEKGEILFPWLYGKDFSIVKIPDDNGVSAVAKAKYIKIDNIKNKLCIEYNGEYYERTYVYGLYSSKEKFVLPMEYDEISETGTNIWICKKNNTVTLVETEEGD